MRIELRVRLEWIPPDVSGVAGAFLEAAEAEVGSLTGENEGQYELTTAELVDDGPTEVDIEAVEAVFEIVLDYEHIEGKFAPKDELSDYVVELIGATGLSEIEHEGLTWSVEDVEVIDRKAEARAEKEAARLAKS
jgi:hypothetical protein